MWRNHVSCSRINLLTLFRQKKVRKGKGGVPFGGQNLSNSIWQALCKLGHPVLWADRLSFEIRTREMLALYDWFCSSQHKKTKTTLGRQQMISASTKTSLSQENKRILLSLIAGVNWTLYPQAIYQAWAWLPKLAIPDTPMHSTKQENQLKIKAKVQQNILFLFSFGVFYISQRAQEWWIWWIRTRSISWWRNAVSSLNAA